jgi:hypothetical protein
MAQVEALSDNEEALKPVTYLLVANCYQIILPLWSELFHASYLEVDDHQRQDNLQVAEERFATFARIPHMLDIPIANNVNNREQ